MLTAIKSLPRTFFSPSFYAALIRQGKGIGLGFVVLLVLFDYALPLLSQLSGLPAVQASIESFFDRLPSMTIKEGKLSIDRSSPYTVDVQFEDTSAFAITFDTTYQETSISALERDMTRNKTDILVTADFVAVKKRQDNSQIEFHRFRDARKDSFEVTHEQLLEIGKKLAAFVPWFFVLFTIPVFLMFFFMTFVKSLMIKLIALFFKEKPDLSGAMRLAAAATMPASLINLLLILVNAGSQSDLARLPGNATFLIWLALAILGLWSVNREEKKPG